jgi:hypothetical protein
MVGAARPIGARRVVVEYWVRTSVRHGTQRTHAEGCCALTDGRRETSACAYLVSNVARRDVVVRDESRRVLCSVWPCLTGLNSRFHYSTVPRPN